MRINVADAKLKTATVEVRALTISGKQVTLAVFRQLEEADLIDCESGALLGLPWGRVNYYWGDCCPSHHWHVVWQLGDELRRACVPKRFPWDGLYHDRLRDAEELMHEAAIRFAAAAVLAGHSEHMLSRHRGSNDSRWLKVSFGNGGYTHVPLNGSVWTELSDSARVVGEWISDYLSDSGSLWRYRFKEPILADLCFPEAQDRLAVAVADMLKEKPARGRIAAQYKQRAEEIAALPQLFIAA